MNPTHGTIHYDAAPALALQNEAQRALAFANDLIIDSPTMLDAAGDDLKRVKGLQKDVEEKRTSITGPLNQAVKAVNDLFRPAADYLKQAEATLKKAILIYQTEQELAAAKARKEAEAAARAERERLAAIEREAQQKALLAQQEAQAAAAAGDKAAAEAAAAEAVAAQQQAQIAAITANVLTVTPTAEEAPKVAGISGRVTYAAQVVDLLALIKAVAAGQAPVQCLQADSKFLSAQARAYKQAGQLFPGVMVTAERSISARAQ